MCFYRKLYFDSEVQFRIMNIGMKTVIGTFQE